MAKVQFKFYNQSQGELFPSFLGEKIPETHHVRLLSGIVDVLDITEICWEYCNKEEDYYVCPMGQHMTLVGVTRKVSDNGFASCSHKYRAQGCTGCPLRSQCYKSKTGQRTIEVNHNLNEHKRKAREMLTSEEGLRHRSQRPIEPEAVSGQLKFDWHYRRFRHKGKDKVYMDFAILAMTHNLRKLMRKAQNELIDGLLKHLSRQCKSNRPHITLVGTNNRNFRIAA